MTRLRAGLVGAGGVLFAVSLFAPALRLSSPVSGLGVVHRGLDYALSILHAPPSVRSIAISLFVLLALSGNVSLPAAAVIGGRAARRVAFGVAACGLGLAIYVEFRTPLDLCWGAGVWLIGGAALLASHFIDR
ncbi:MAG: hypothetical protein AAF610_01455 [Pseudomonadota bacterium]